MQTGKMLIPDNSHIFAPMSKFKSTYFTTGGTEGDNLNLCWVDLRRHLHDVYGSIQLFMDGWVDGWMAVYLGEMKKEDLQIRHQMHGKTVSF